MWCLDSCHPPCTPAPPSPSPPVTNQFLPLRGGLLSGPLTIAVVYNATNVNGADLSITGYALTSQGPISNYYSLDVRPIISGSSVGSFNDFYAGRFIADNGGTEVINALVGVGAQVGGAATNAMSLYAKRPTLSAAPGAILNLSGILIEDHSGIGTTTSYNISSLGAASVNLLSGTIRLGHATNAAPQDGDLWYDGTHLNFRHGGTTTALV